MLAVGFIVVLGLAIGLVQLTRGARPIPASPPSSRGAAPTPVAASPGAPTAPESARVAIAPRGPAAAAAKQPGLPAAPVRFDRELKRDANGNLVPIIPAKELREQLPLSDAPMKACIERSGQHPTGKATLNFTVAAKDNHLFVATTGVQDEETLAAYPDLLECMHKTATVLLPEGRPVPELGTPIYVRRHVRIENGVLAENTIFDFSYHP
ncbi:MAG TPA: hypothetical protein VK601_21315 [Kofleriaceae bacterium]|nr:hypothetical protein [Kofleriaceae bacterium]